MAKLSEAPVSAGHYGYTNANSENILQEQSQALQRQDHNGVGTVSTGHCTAWKAEVVQCGMRECGGFVVWQMDVCAWCGAGWVGSGACAHTLGMQGGIWKVNIDAALSENNPLFWILLASTDRSHLSCILILPAALFVISIVGLSPEM